MTTPIEFIIDSIRPHKTKFELVRIGGNNDGGYLLPDDFENIKFCFSPGVGNVVSFEKHLLNSYNIRTHFLDRTVDNLPEDMDYLSFEKYFLDNEDTSTTKSLNSWVVENDHDDDMILQMDIEGGEYSVINSVTESILKKFRIIAIEFHGFQNFYNVKFQKSILKTFLKLQKYFIPVHIHPNNCCGEVEIDGKLIPKVFEVTYLRKDRSPSFGYCTEFPHPLDEKNVLYNDDLIISGELFLK